MKRQDKNIIKTNNSMESDEYKKLITLVIIIASAFILFYILTSLFTKKDNDDIFKNDLNPTEIGYDEIIIGSMFNKDGEYFVLLIKEDDQYKSLYNEYVNSIKNNNKIYTVDLSSAFNKQYLSDENSYDKDDFKVKDTLLLRIDNNEIKDHYDSREEIIEKLEDLSKE